MAIGSGSEGAQSALQEHYKDDMSLADAEVLALQTLKQVMEEKVRHEGAAGVWCVCGGGVVWRAPVWWRCVRAAEPSVCAGACART
jgi:hypothetical protein